MSWSDAIGACSEVMSGTVFKSDPVTERRAQQQRRATVTVTQFCYLQAPGCPGQTCPKTGSRRQNRKEESYSKQIFNVRQRNGKKNSKNSEPCRNWTATSICAKEVFVELLAHTVHKLIKRREKCNTFLDLCVWVGCTIFRTPPLHTEHGLFCNPHMYPHLKRIFQFFFSVPTSPVRFVFWIYSINVQCFQHTAWTCLCVHPVHHGTGISVKPLGNIVDSIGHTGAHTFRFWSRCCIQNQNHRLLNHIGVMPSFGCHCNVLVIAHVLQQLLETRLSTLISCFMRNLIFLFNLL